MKLEMNDEFVEAYMAMDVHNDNLFLTGKAGTGKSTLIRYFLENTGKNVAVVAPTGIAALNVKGQTVHRFCGFGSDVSLDAVAKDRYRPRTRQQRSLLQRLDCLIVDEVSMLRADLLDCLQGYLSLYGPRANMPFGGVQMIFVGDLYQLPPVLLGKERHMFRVFYDTPYFFSANCMSGFDYKLIELQKVYRQEDEDFISLLNAFRDGTAGPDEINKLNDRYVDEGDDDYPSDVGVVLTTTNQRAKEINEEALNRLNGASFSNTARIEGRFTKDYYPTDPELDWRDGARIMLLNNDSGGRWVNGSMGTIVETLDAGTRVMVKLDVAPELDFDGDILHDLDGEPSDVVEVQPHQWQVYSPTIEEEVVVNENDEEEKKEKLVLKSVGSFRQLPFKLAWAVTIHKSQGQTFSDLFLDTGNGIFADGQLYTALSRCTSYKGLRLCKYIVPKDVRTSWQVRDFMRRCNQ